jgi:excinuclease ABC subunit A
MKITNAYQNNLKNIDVRIPENRLIVITGLSGSGKSSLAMGVIANEGYRYFLESLPAYNQQNGHMIPTAEVDNIQNLPPVIKVEQTKRFQAINTTFGTLSDIAAVFRILFARYSAATIMSKSLFSFNHPKGACEVCRGIGEAEYIDLDKLIGNPNKTLREGAITTTLPNGYIVYSQVTVAELNKVCKAHNFNADIPWAALSAEQKEVVLNGSNRLKVFYGKHGLESRLRWQGIKAKPREEGYYKGMLPIMQDILRRDRNPNILKFSSAKVCPSCQGGRIKKEQLTHQWKGLNFKGWMELSLNDLDEKLKQLDLNAGEQRLIHKISSQLLDFIRLGMGHYQLSTRSTSISSGDGQRIKLIRQVNSNLQGILYVFDEPSIGLSANYQSYLRHILKRLIKRGNTVLVVEHDLEFIQAADWIVELGPRAGRHGGEVVFNGAISDFLKDKNLKSPTLSAIKTANTQAISTSKNKPKKGLVHDFLPKAKQLSVVSRKTPALRERMIRYCEQERINLIIVSDQPIGKTPRSNPATYTGLADKIRDLLAKTPEAKSLKFGKGAFSFNTKNGRCEGCEGAGVIALSMSVMGNINQICPTCNGKRFKTEVLRVHYKNKNIATIYNLSIEAAYDFFSGEKKITETLNLMLQLGLGYLTLGQPSNTLSGGEAQRIKLTKHFAKKSKQTLLVLEEPSIGLHQENVGQLLAALNQLKQETAGILCFENHPLFQSECDLWVDNSLEVPSIDTKEEAPQQRDFIAIRGARTHTLKDVAVDFPKQQLSVVTGVSGSGKSSLLIDTLHGYGLQEMTRQFSTYQQSRVGVNFQFEVDTIEGLTPTICITRKQKNDSQRSDISIQTGMEKMLRFAFSRKAQYEGEELSASHFSNNHALGKCAVCEGFGQELLPDFKKLILDSDKSISSGLFANNKAISYYGDPAGKHMAILKCVGIENGFSLETPFKALTSKQQAILLQGTGDTIWEADWLYQTKTRAGTQALRMPWEGFYKYLQDEYFKTRKNKNIGHLTALFTHQECSYCQGSGLKPERLAFLIANKSIHAVKAMDFKALGAWLAENASLSKDIDGKLLFKIAPHLHNIITSAQELHIDYLQLNRKLPTLSGGENQRIALIKQLNSPLKGITYILDEPSAGLSQENIPDLIRILKKLRDKGNTVLVIEHDKSIIHAADHLVQMGPKAGELGGYITYQGSVKGLLKQADCHPFLKAPSKAVQLKTGTTHINIRELAKHTLKKDALALPVGGITALTGKSGIGKTTLVKDILIPSIETKSPVNCGGIHFPKTYAGATYFESKKLRTYASTLLVSYLDLLKEVCKVFASETNHNSKDFSYKTKKSQCSNCNGKGVVETSLDITANAIETCEDCKGQRYQKKVLAHSVQTKNIAEVLAMNITELKVWFTCFKVSKNGFELLKNLEEIGLAHLCLDQTVQTLSSGEKQRLLLLNWLQDKPKNNLFVLDEPSTGLSYVDIDLLFEILEKLSIDNDILVIEHNLYLLEKIGVGFVLT